MVLAYRARVLAVICRRGLLLPSLHALSLTLALTLAGIATATIAIAADVLLLFVLLGRTTGGLSASYSTLVDVYVVATAVATAVATGVAVVVIIVAIAFSGSGGWTFGGPC